MAASLEETLISVWRQAMVEEAKTVILENRQTALACCCLDLPIQLSGIHQPSQLMQGQR